MLAIEPRLFALSAEALPFILSTMPTTAQLKKAVLISEKLDALEAELAAILGGSSGQ